MSDLTQSESAIKSHLSSLADQAGQREAICAVIAVVAWGFFERHEQVGTKSFCPEPNYRLSALSGMDLPKRLGAFWTAKKAIEGLSPVLKSAFGRGGLLDVFRPDKGDSSGLKARILGGLITAVSNFVQGATIDDVETLFERLIRSANDERHGFGLSITPTVVANCMAGLVSPSRNESLYDPVCGAGELLVAGLLRQRAAPPTNGSAVVAGEEKDQRLWALAQIRLLLHGVEPQISHADCLQQATGSAGQFDVVMANPPFSLPWRWESQSLSQVDGHAPKTADYAFILHVINSLNFEGRGAIVMPKGVLFRGGAERRIRERIIQRDVIEAVIELPSNLFPGTSIAPCIMLFKKSKVAARRESILFVDSSKLSDTERARSLSPEAINRITETVSTWRQQPGFAKAVSLKEIGSAEWDLSVSRYVAPETRLPRESLSSVLTELEELVARRNQCEEEVRAALRSRAASRSHKLIL